MPRKVFFFLTIHQQFRKFKIQPSAKSPENKKKRFNQIDLFPVNTKSLPKAKFGNFAESSKIFSAIAPITTLLKTKRKVLKRIIIILMRKFLFFFPKKHEMVKQKSCFLGKHCYSRGFSQKVFLKDSFCKKKIFLALFQSKNTFKSVFIEKKVKTTTSPQCRMNTWDTNAHLLSIIAFLTS